MLHRFRSHLTHNVVAYLALFVALGGTSAYAANTVFSADIVDGEVKTPDLGQEAVTQNKIALNSVGSARVTDNSLTGADIRDNALKNADIDKPSLLAPLSFFVAPTDWRTSSDGATVSHGTGNATLGRTDAGTGLFTLPVSYPTRVGDRPLRVTTFRLCRTLGSGVTITSYGILTGSGSSFANADFFTPVSKTGAGCDTIAMSDLGREAFEADGDVTFEIAANVSYPAGGGSAQFGGAKLTLNLGPPG